MANDENTITNLRNKVKMLENKTNRLQSMNEIFLDLLKNQQKINRNHIRQNPDFIQRFENKFNHISTNPIYPPEYNKLKMKKSNSQLNMFNIKDIKYYREPIKLMQEQLKAYIFQTTLDRRRQEYLINEQINDLRNEVHNRLLKRRQEYLINEQINDLRNEVHNRLLKLEHRQQLQLSTIRNSINTGTYNNLDLITQKLMIQQRDRENLENFMEEKLNDLTNINKRYNGYRNNNNQIYINNRFFNSNDNSTNNNNSKYNNFFG